MPYECNEEDTLPMDYQAKQQRTLEPWHVGMMPGPMVYGPKGELVADCRNTFASNEAGPNALRIVACVNACKGMANPEQAIPAMRGALRQAREYISALLAMEPDAATDSLVNNGEEVEETIRAAIAKATGGTL